jgi:beta-fructofuranosidase
MSRPLASMVPALALAALSACASAQPAVRDPAGFKDLFDGITLDGWKAADMSYWSVEDGAITGTITPEHPLKVNLYLIWQGGEMGDFELTMRHRVFGSKGINCGYQFRSKELPDHDVAGYQMDNNLGTDWLVRLYDEHGRHTLAMRGNRVVYGADGQASTTAIPGARGPASFRLEEWNDYHLVCVGPRLTLYVNGELAAEVIDNDPKQQDLSGILGLQLHSGPPTTAQFKEIRYRPLKPGDAPTRPAAPEPGPAAAPLLQDKTLVAWARPANLTQRGGSVLTVDDNAGHFDGLVFGELAPARWMAGSDMWKRTHRAQDAWPAETAGAATRVQVAAVYRGKEVVLYRDGREYARYAVAEPQAFGADLSVVMGLRHLDAADRACFAGAIDDARIYAAALTAEQVAALEPGKPSDPLPFAWWRFEDGTAADAMKRFPPARLVGGARIEGGRLILDGRGSWLVTPPTAGPESAAAPPRFDSPVHFRPREARLADTIPFFWKGEYHVFYLHAVNGTPWEHIVSRDLVTWTELPAALRQDPADAQGPDGGNMFTGSVVEHAGTFHLFYTGHNPKNPQGMEHVCHATSPDLVTWTKHPAHAFGADGVHYKVKSDFRDPYVFWNGQEQRWWMLLCAREAQGGKPAQGLARSADLVRWEQAEPLVFDPPLKAGTPECPDLFRCGGTWYLIHSPSAGTTDVRHAKDLRGPWRSPDPAAIDTPVLYAAKRMHDGKRHVLTGWIRDLRGFKDRGGWEWGGTQSLPREAYEGADGELWFKPIDEALAVFTRTHFEGQPRVDPGAPWSLEVPDHYLLDCQVRLDAQGELTVTFRQQPDGAETYRLVLLPAQGQARLSGPGFSYKRTCRIDASKPVRIQAFVQGRIIECFVDGRYAYSCRAYSFARGKLGLEVQGGPAQVDVLRVKLAP